MKKNKNLELIWSGKYKSNENNQSKIIKPFPFQIVESINVPRVEKEKYRNLTLFDFWEGNEGSTFEEG